MKKILLTLACAAAALGVCAAPQEVGFDKLPKPAREFIEKNFSMETIKSVELDRKSTWDRYVVCFDNGYRSQVDLRSSSTLLIDLGPVCGVL